jgi:uncharacterized membrane protein
MDARERKPSFLRREIGVMMNENKWREPLRNQRGQVLGLSARLAHIVAAWTICLLGVVLRFAFLTRHSFDGDEFASYYFSHFSFWQLWTEELDTHPPLYYSIQKLILALGDSEALLRTPVALMGSLSVLLTYLLARRIAGGTAALLAAALMAISPGQIYLSQWARPYALFTVASLVTALTVVGIFNNYAKATLSTFGQRALYVLSLTTALYAHNIAFVFFAITASFGLAAIVASRSPKCLVEWAGLNGLVLLLWSSWLIVMIHQARAGLINLSWLAPPTLSFARDNLAFAYATQFAFHFRSVSKIATLTAVGIVLISAGIIVNRRASARIPLTYLIALVVCTPAAEIAISLIWRPIFEWPIIMWTVPFLYILAALVITSLRSPRVYGVVLPSVAAIFILNLYAYYRHPFRGDYRTLIEEVYPALQNGDVIVTVHPWENSGIKYYLSKYPAHGLTVIDRSTTLMRSVAHLPAASAVPLPPTADRIWLIRSEDEHGDSELSSDLTSYRLVRRVIENEVSAELYQETHPRP